MDKGETIAKVIRALSCLVVAFSLVFLPSAAAHAAAGAHGVHSAIERGEASTVQHAHSHSAAQLDCGSGKLGTSASDTGAYQCCAGMCMAAILIEAFASPYADAVANNLAIPHKTPVASETHGFLRPPRHLI
ncbi:MAG: hypothetical protein P8O10_11825 [Pseudorhodobacter sp.]|nr:hypothetical protein [Pseudorhodobacter sp.]